MNENRGPPRVRPRPYDLRRRVLLKNFLREQMTQIPQSPEPSPDQNIDSSAFQEDSSSSVGNEENIETSNVQDQVSSSTIEPIAISNTIESNDNADDAVSSTSETITMTDIGENPPPKPSKLLNLLRTKLTSVQKKKGISKAKVKLKGISPAKSLKISQKVPTESSVKSRAESFFSRFKKRRNKKHKNTLNSSPMDLRSSSSCTKSDSCTVSSQSVQTDSNWSNTDYHQNLLEESNKNLREENRLLSESLSNIMTSFSFKLSPLKIPYGTESYITASGITEAPHKHNDSSLQQNYERNLKRYDGSNAKVLRSKSLYDKPNRGIVSRAGTRTRSMNRGYDRFREPSSSGSYSKFENSSNGVYHARYESFTSTNNSSSRHHHNSSPNRTNTRMTPYTSPVLKNIPVNNSSRIVRRSSMPERVVHKPIRPLVRRSSTRNNDFNQRFTRYNDNRYNDNNHHSQKRRSSGSRPVPFQDLPREAFY